MPAHQVKVGNGRVLVDIANATKRSRAPGPLRLPGLSTTATAAAEPRFAGSGHVLAAAAAAADSAGAETRTIKLNDLKFRHCEGSCIIPPTGYHLVEKDDANTNR